MWISKLRLSPGVWAELEWCLTSLPSCGAVGKLHHASVMWWTKWGNAVLPKGLMTSIA